MYHTSIDLHTEVRVARQDDIITAARMIFESYAPYIPIMGKIPPTLFEDFGNHISNRNLWLLHHFGSPVGMVVLTPGDDHMLLQSMCILPAYQGMGFGRKLLEFSESCARQSAKPVIRLYTNSLMERNQKIYKRNGYKETHRTAYDWGWRVHMEKRVPRRTSASKKASFQHLANALG